VMVPSRGQPPPPFVSASGKKVTLPRCGLRDHSESTCIRDLGDKRTTYDSSASARYFLFDPEDRWLNPPLQGLSLFKERSPSHHPGRSAAWPASSLGVRLVPTWNPAARRRSTDGRRWSCRHEQAEQAPNCPSLPYGRRAAQERPRRSGKETEKVREQAEQAAGSNLKRPRSHPESAGRAGRSDRSSACRPKQPVTRAAPVLTHRLLVQPGAGFPRRAPQLPHQVAKLLGRLLVAMFTSASSRRFLS